tara:strand:- start:20106 stop:20435 length:330 start_codon:yes stop_codon:yes gene_type:complete
MKIEFKNNILLIYNDKKDYYNGYFLNLFDTKYNTSDWVIVIKNTKDFYLINNEIVSLQKKKINNNLYSLVVVLLFKEEVPFIESINYAPSLIEAFDIIEIERIERDLKI